MSACPRQVAAFARRWHRKNWALSLLPVELSAKIIVDDADVSVLGVAATAVGRKKAHTIGLNSLIIESPIHLAILAHESAHCICQHKVGLCGEDWIERKLEREAWLGAAQLAFSTDQIRAVRAGAMSPALACEQSSVPDGLLRIRLAMEMDYDIGEPLIRWAEYLHVAARKLERRQALRVSVGGRDHEPRNHRRPQDRLQIDR